MIRKLIAIILAVLINAAVLVWFHTWSTTAMASAAPSPRTDKALVLPTITVYPTRAQLESLGRHPAPATTSVGESSGTGDAQTLVMPYYSFADSFDAADNG